MMFHRKVTQTTKVTRADGTAQETTTVTEERTDAPPPGFKFEFAEFEFPPSDLGKLFPGLDKLFAEARRVFGRKE